MLETSNRSYPLPSLSVYGHHGETVRCILPEQLAGLLPLAAGKCQSLAIARWKNAKLL